MTPKYIILDRDGVINFDSVEHIRSEKEWVAIPGSLEAIGRLCRAGWRVVIVTNQSGLSSGKLTVGNFNAINQKMITHLAQFGGSVEAIFFCPHSSRAGCECRKPKPGMLLEFSRRTRIPLAGIPVVGDKLSDIQAAEAAGARPMLVRTGYGQEVLDQGRLPPGVAVYDDLAAVAEDLLHAG
jgi:D-glycero-D-manno-heptose 1,7-bisphosphate phosphatase